MEAYEETIREYGDGGFAVACGARRTTNGLRASIVVVAVSDPLASLSLDYPKVSAAKQEELATLRTTLLAAK